MLAAVGLFAVAIGCYLNALGGPLLYDDLHAIVENRAVRGVDLRAIFLTPSWWGTYNAAYRPVTVLSFALNHAIHGTEPFGYHLVNVLLHGVATVLVASLLLRLTKRRFVALLTGLLFATHPVHTEAVAGVVGRAEVLVALFGLAAWLVLLGREGSERGARRTAVAAGLFLLAMLSKETAIGFVGAIVVADLLYVTKETAPRPSIVRSWVFFGAAALAALAVRTVVIGRITPEVGRLDNVLAGAPAVPRLLTAVAVVAKYAATLVWPFRLSADYSYPQVPLLESPADPLVLAGLVVLIGLAALAVWGWRRSPDVAFAVVFMAATFAVVSNLLIPIGTIMAERLLYVPSIGFCLLAAIGIERAGRVAPATSRLAIVLGLVLASGWAIGTVARNRVWTDRLRFFETMVRDAPDSARSHRETAVVLSELGQHDRAREEVQLALRLDPANPVTLYNLGNVELRAGRLNEAVAAYQAALKEDPQQVDAMVNLGNAYSAGGDERSAEQWFRRGLALRPDSSSVRLNLGNALLRQGRPGDAEEHYRVAIARLPDDALGHFNYGVCLESLGRFGDAIDQYRAALIGMPDAPIVAVRMVAALVAAGRRDEALAQQAAIEARFPDDPRVHQTRQLLTRTAPAP